MHSLVLHKWKEMQDDTSENMRHCHIVPARYGVSGTNVYSMSNKNYFAIYNENDYGIYNMNDYNVQI